MNRYQLTLYNSGGYKDRETVETPYEIVKNNEPECQGWQVIDKGTVIGGEAIIEQLVNSTRGWTEEYSIVKVEKV